jgi:hypothetical protein
MAFPTGAPVGYQKIASMSTHFLRFAAKESLFPALQGTSSLFETVLAAGG